MTFHFLNSGSFSGSSKLLFSFNGPNLRWPNNAFIKHKPYLLIDASGRKRKCECCASIHTHRERERERESRKAK